VDKDEEKKRIGEEVKARVEEEVKKRLEEEVKKRLEGELKRRVEEGMEGTKQAKAVSKEVASKDKLIKVSEPGSRFIRHCGCRHK
jgi:predicted PP-loop superfamily ATPase